MAKPYKVDTARPLPANAETVIRDGSPHVCMIVNGRKVYFLLTKDGTKYLRPSKSYYFDIRDENGIVRRITGYADLKATEQYAAEMERKASRIRSGVIDPAEEHALRPLSEHLTDYAAFLESKGNTSVHVRQTIGRASAMFSGCKFVFPLETDAGKASEWLNSLRRNRASVELPEGEAFTPGDVAKLLGISGSAVRAAVLRLTLPAVGNGKARKLPRSAVEALALNQAKGCSPETVNHYIRAVRAFFRWLVKAKRLGSNPLDSLTLVNSATDVRRTRRELNADELRRLFEAARASESTYRGMSGPDRYMLYLTAAGTGFRANALANLTQSDFDFSESIVTLPARFNKSRKLKVQPLPPDVAEALREYLNGKPPGSLVWGGPWASQHRGAEMLRIDLKAAGIPYSVEGPDGPEYADFHSLRHSYLTLGSRSGIDLRTLQVLAGHSKPELTARYTHRRLHDLVGAVAKLPNLVPGTPMLKQVSEIPLLKTGTDDAVGFTYNSDVVPDVVTCDIRTHRDALLCTSDRTAGKMNDVQKTLKNKEPALIRTGPHRLALTRATGIEPATSGSTVRW